MFLSLGEVMIRDTPADSERLERTRQVYVSTAGSEYSIAIGVSRLGNKSRFITRLPNNSYGRMVEGIAKENGVDTEQFVWADRTDLIGRYLYEIGVTPRAGLGIYQRKFSAASRLEAAEVDWRLALKKVKILHTSGITLGLSFHSGYERNYLLECIEHASKAREQDALFGLDINYRGTLWSKEQMLPTVEKVFSTGVNILITSVEDSANFFGFNFGKFTANKIIAGTDYGFDETALEELGQAYLSRYGIRCLCLTRRKIVSSACNKWMSAIVLDGEKVFTSEKELEFQVVDRLGGGDAWASGFYTGILEDGLTPVGVQNGLRLGDAAISLQQTLMFDLPIFNRDEVNSLAMGENSQRVRR
jgi:2-dehydro-3-deoxygluconokinase